MAKNRLHLLSNALKFVGGWGSAPDSARGADDAPQTPIRKGLYAFGACQGPRIQRPLVHP